MSTNSRKYLTLYPIARPSLPVWPTSPVCAGPLVLGAADNLALQTRVNGELRQDSNTNDLLFGVREIIAHASQGTTPEPGSLIMTSTPAGVALGMKTPKYLSDGDIVEVSIEGLGIIKNRIPLQTSNVLRHLRSLVHINFDPVKISVELVVHLPLQIRLPLLLPSTEKGPTTCF